MLTVMVPILINKDVFEPTVINFHESEDADGLQKLSATPLKHLQETGAWVLQSHKILPIA